MSVFASAGAGPSAVSTNPSTSIRVQRFVSIAIDDPPDPGVVSCAVISEATGARTIPRGRGRSARPHPARDALHHGGVEAEEAMGRERLARPRLRGITPLERHHLDARRPLEL